jgi:hypothetical protein
MSDVYSLPYNQVSFKASHNSYDRDETLVQQLAWDPAKPWQGGCRGLELDINQSSSGNQWSVGHVGGYSSKERQLSQFLNELRVWSQSNPGHDVVTLYLDLKNVHDGFASGLDQYVSQYLGRPIYRPVDLMGRQSSVPEGARVNGWPALSQLRERFLVVLSGDKAAKAAYAADDPRARLCFADKDCGASEVPSSTDRVFFNYHLYSADKKKWTPVFQGQATNPASIIRGYVLNGEDLWNDAVSAGCNVPATDKVRNHDWARVSSSAPFTQLKPLVAASAAAAGLAAASAAAGEAEAQPA